MMQIKNYFKNTPTNILNNTNLRDPQVDAYIATYNHFVTKKSKEPAIIILPTGVGKTGVISMLPYNIAEGRVLVIAPQMTVLSTLEKGLDSSDFDCFWYDKKVISNNKNLPQVSLYRGGNFSEEVYSHSNIILTNIQQTQVSNARSIINTLSPDFFDMIIIDEAHHAEANSWINTINHFKEAKVIKLTGTPFRTDEKSLTGELVFKYKLSQAMANNYVKSLKSISYVPDILKLTIDGKDNEYTVEEIYEMGIGDEQWVSRSVAFSETCKNSIVNESMEILKSKKKDSGIPHKIIASAMNIEEAEKITQLYREKGILATFIHSKMTQEQKEQVFSDIENNRVDVVVNVAMMGEGYDHKYFSVAAIFRPFRSMLPYEQFVGRILRYIPDEETENPGDNIATIVSHQYFYMEQLWKNYKDELQEADIIKGIRQVQEADDTKNGNNPNDSIDFASVFELGQGSVETDVYLTTTLLEKEKRYQEERKHKIEELQTLLNISKEEAEEVLLSSQSDVEMKRPDVLYDKTRRATDTNITEVTVPHILRQCNLNPKTNEIHVEFLSLFPSKYSWIRSRSTQNDAILVIYLNSYLKEKIGYGRSDWGFNDFEIASKLLEEQAKFIEEKLKGK